MKKQFVKQAKLPNGAYKKPLKEVLSVYKKPLKVKGGDQNGKESNES